MVLIPLQLPGNDAPPFFFFFLPRLVLKPSTLPDIQVTDVDATMKTEGTISSTGETEMDLAAPL